MKKLAKILLVLGLTLVGLANEVYAQKRMRQISPEELSARLTEKMKENLNLSEEQTEKVKEIHQKYVTQMQQKMQNIREQRNFLAAKAEIKAIRKAKEAELKAIFTEEQYALYLEKKNEMKDKRVKMWKNRRQIREFAKSESFEQMRNELQAYREQNIMPILKEQRAKLETQLTVEDKQVIQQIRTDLDAIKPQIKSIRDKIRANRKAGQLPDEVQTQALKELLEKNKNKIATLKGIADKYQTEISALHDEINPQKEQWRKEMKAIFEKYTNQNELSQFPQMERILGKKVGFGKAFFLLLKPEQNLQPNTKDFTIYPNPSKSFTNINFAIKKAGKIQIDLKDKEGKLIRNVLNEYKEAGEHTLQIDTQDLATGIYYYTITDAKGTKTKKLFVQQ